MDLARLKAEFSDSELEWKPQQTGWSGDKPWVKVLCYVSARAIQDRLDEVFGVLGWQDEYRFEAHGTMCKLSVKIGDEWVTKENGSQETDIESFKGGISSAFKRVAASGFGIGRYLYSLDTVFATTDTNKQYGKDWNYVKAKDGKPAFYWQNPKIGKQSEQPTETIDNPIITKQQELLKIIGDDIKLANEIKATLKITNSLDKMTMTELESMINEARKV